MAAKAKLGVLAAAGIVLAAVHFVRVPAPDPVHLPSLARPPSESSDAPALPLSGRVPRGAPPTLSCVAARAIVAQINTRLVQPPDKVDEAAFADAVIDWLDPHGLWSAAPASASGEAIKRHAHGLLAVLRDPRAPCTPAVEVGKVLAKSVGDLRTTFERARAASGVARVDAGAALPSFAQSIFEPGEVKRAAPALAEMLGEGSGDFERTGVEGATSLVESARDRYFPPLGPEAWGDAVLAAAVRAYVPIVDPHGGWAPFEEEASLYEAELEARPPAPFWEAISRTPIGVRIDGGPLAPLATGDLVLTIEGIPLGGMPLEQIEQLAYAVADERARTTMLVLSENQKAPRVVTVELPTPEALAATREGLGAERVRYGDGEALVVAIHDVREDLGDELSREISHAASQAPLSGVVLDLRGNGGGSTDGAAAALGVFLPGAPLFPMRRRDGTIEIDRATEPPLEERWDGAVAAIVDRSTASAAEMIAGALGAYHRGVVVGERTFGKGCAQEYVEDEADVGVLRLTTLVFALPDGNPLQRTGLLPSIIVPFETPSNETESSLPGSPFAFKGPDVRDARKVATFAARTPWPALGKGDVGPCRDEGVCRSLRALATAVSRRAAKKR